MGVLKDLGTGRVASIHPDFGYPMDEYKHLLNPIDFRTGKLVKFKIGTELFNLTNPYGHLYFAIGSADDFVCFDYAALDLRKLTGAELWRPSAKDRSNRAWYVLHATVNSETGHFIQNFDYMIVPRVHVTKKAAELTNRALDWCAEGGDPGDWIKHDKRGWNQDEWFFYRCVYLHAAYAEVPDFSERQKRFGGKRINEFCGL